MRVASTNALLLLATQLKPSYALQHAMLRTMTSHPRASLLATAATFELLSEDEYVETLQSAAPDDVSVVQFRPRWVREDYDDVGPILEHAVKRWPGANFYATALTRGTAQGERVFEHLKERNFVKTPLIEVYFGSECVDTLVMPGARRGDAGDAEAGECPLLAEPRRVGLLQQTIESAQRRIAANRRWRERRRVLLALRQVRQDLRRLDGYREAGLLSRSWRLFDQADTQWRDGHRSFSPEQREAAQLKHLNGLISHQRDVTALRAQAVRLERRRRLLNRLVLGRQRCSADGCVLL